MDASLLEIIHLGFNKNYALSPAGFAWTKGAYIKK
jgi:hypothetical protein